MFPFWQHFSKQKNNNKFVIHVADHCDVLAKVVNFMGIFVSCFLCLNSRHLLWSPVFPLIVPLFGIVFNGRSTVQISEKLLVKLENPNQIVYVLLVLWLPLGYFCLFFFFLFKKQCFYQIFCLMNSICFLSPSQSNFDVSHFIARETGFQRFPLAPYVFNGAGNKLWCSKSFSSPQLSDKISLSVICFGLLVLTQSECRIHGV